MTDNGSTNDDDLRARYPTLASWLTGASEDHPWMPLLRNPDPYVGSFAKPLETILAELERARPAHIARKRRAFRRDTQSALTLRAELNVGWVLANSECPFDFGGGPARLRVLAGTQYDVGGGHD